MQYTPPMTGTALSISRVACVGGPLAAAFALLLASSAGAEMHTRNVVLVTLDGVRVQELFSGLDPAIAEHAAADEYSDIELARERYWRDTPRARREALMPNFWTRLVPMGVVYGNAQAGSRVTVENAVKWSSPGYAELLTGKPQPDILDNTLVRYPHVTVLEHVRESLALDFHEVAQFGSWDGFRMIAASRDDAFLMNGAYDALPERLSSPEMDELVALRRQVMGLWEESSNDVLTMQLATAYLERHEPRLVWIGLGQSDDWAHADRYDRLLDYLHLADGMLGDLWDTLQSLPQYRDRTTLVITTDHGRGRRGEDWAEHDESIPGSEDVWIAVIGPDTPDSGDIAPAPPLVQGAVAATILELFGLAREDFDPEARPAVPGAL